VLLEAFNGHFKKNPFNLQHFKATNISVLVNGTAHPIENNMLIMDSTNLANVFHVAHQQLYGLGIGDSAMSLTLDNFKSGTFYWPVNLDATEKTGVLRLQIDYEQALANAVTVIIIADFDRRLERDGKVTAA
jgi:hypothetical protein